MNILISACLMGVNCRYSGDSQMLECIPELMKKHHLIPVCPEIYGGMSTPRVASEIRSDGSVYNKEGEDVTEHFQRGAREVLKLAELYDCKYAIMKERSPSCGSGRIYDGTFTKTIVDGDGVAAKLLKKHGITVIGESQIEGIMGEL